MRVCICKNRAFLRLSAETTLGFCFVSSTCTRDGPHTHEYSQIPLQTLDFFSFFRFDSVFCLVYAFRCLVRQQHMAWLISFMHMYIHLQPILMATCQHIYYVNIISVSCLWVCVCPARTVYRVVDDLYFGCMQILVASSRSLPLRFLQTAFLPGLNKHKKSRGRPKHPTEIQYSGDGEKKT